MSVSRSDIKALSRRCLDLENRVSQSEEQLGFYKERLKNVSKRVSVIETVSFFEENQILKQQIT
jgi:hypothetical protein